MRSLFEQTDEAVLNISSEQKKMNVQTLATRDHVARSTENMSKSLLAMNEQFESMQADLKAIMEKRKK